MLYKSLAIMNRMLLFSLLAVFSLALSAPAEAPRPDSGSAHVMQLVDEVRAQQGQITINQQNIDEKLAALAESIRVARIYSSRGGR